MFLSNRFERRLIRGRKVIRGAKNGRIAIVMAMRSIFDIRQNVMDLQDGWPGEFVGASNFVLPPIHSCQQGRINNPLIEKAWLAAESPLHSVQVFESQQKSAAHSGRRTRNYLRTEFRYALIHARYCRKDIGTRPFISATRHKRHYKYLPVCNCWRLFFGANGAFTRPLPCTNRRLPSSSLLPLGR